MVKNMPANAIDIRYASSIPAEHESTNYHSKADFYAER